MSWFLGVRNFDSFVSNLTSCANVLPYLCTLSSNYSHSSTSGSLCLTVLLDEFIKFIAFEKDKGE